ncbi:MAG: LppX_LprAFG lipoprotein [Ilumatobacter sp.]|nr:LppX_LprAFG lipoprotein [Ilumatobacter sp.]
MTTRRRPDGPVLFAELMLVAAATALVAVVAFAFRSTEPAVFADADDGGSGDAEVVDLDDGAVADPDADVDEVVAAAAEAMGEVTSVEFRLDRDGAPIYIDEFESLALDSLIGQFTVPNQARAQLTVTVDGNLTTEIAAVAIDDEVWISNPVTGDFETLPPGFDIDPSRFFDPEDGWQPLLANLRDVELVGIDDRGGERYHVRGVAPASEVENITVGLVDGQDVPVDLWIHPGTHLVTHLEFSTTIDGADSQWVLDLDRYGESFTIRPPANVRTGVDS